MGATYKKPMYEKQVEFLLKKYPVWLKSIEVGEVEFPSCISSYSERVSFSQSNYQSSTERYGLRRIEKVEFINKIDIALEVLDETERELIEMRYFSNYYPVHAICETLSVCETTYRSIRKQALVKLAEALNIL